MKELALRRLRDVNPRIKQLPTEELEKKIEFLYSLGYVFNPYEVEFFNPFIDISLNPNAISDLSIESINKSHFLQEKEYLEKNKSIKSFHKIKNEIYGNDKTSRIGIYFEMMSGQIGLYLLLFSTILYIFNITKTAILCHIISFIFSNMYLFQNLIISEIQGEWELSKYWKKNKNLFMAITLISYPYLYYRLFELINNFWIPAIIIIIIFMLLKKIINRKLSREFWQMIGINDIKEYAEKNGFL